MGVGITAISGANIVGYYLDTNGAVVGACYNGSTWTTLDDAVADPSSAVGTEPTGISGANIVGEYGDSDGVSHTASAYNGSFLYNSTTNWTTLDDPSAGSGSGQGTVPFDISGTIIVGGTMLATAGLMASFTTWSPATGRRWTIRWARMALF